MGAATGRDDASGGTRRMGNTVMTQALRTAGIGRRATGSDRASGLGVAARRGRVALRVRAGACRGLSDGGGVRPRRPAGEALRGHAAVGRPYHWLGALV